MKNKIVKIPKSNRYTFFRRYIELINPLLNLRSKELDLLAGLMYYNDYMAKEFKDPESPLKWKQLFSKEIKDEICILTGLSNNTLANNLSSLRNKNIIVKGKLRKDLTIYPDAENFQLIFAFTLEEENNTTNETKELEENTGRDFGLDAVDEDDNGNRRDSEEYKESKDTEPQDIDREEY